jgi:large subunit ribosomal protein L9
MKIILLEELKGRGGEGDVVDVATGYAVNFLLPRKLAIPATPGNLKQLEQRRHNIAKREEQRLDTADRLLAALEGQTVRIGAKVGEEGQLFGSVTAARIAEAIKARFGAEVDRKRIDVHGAIKTAGEHGVTVSIYRDVKANMTVEVVDEDLLRAEAAAEGAEAAEDEAAVKEAVVEAEAIEDGTVVEAEVAFTEDEAEAAIAEALIEAAIAEGVAEVGAVEEAVVEAAVADVKAEAEAEAAEVEAAVEAAVAAVVEAEAEAVIETAEEGLKEAAKSLARAADAAQDDVEAADAEELADAAVEVLRDIEGAVDAAIADAEER